MRDSNDDREMSVVAEACLNWLVEDVTELERFMNLCGYSPESLRSALGSHGLNHGLIDYFGRNEPLLLAMCSNAGIEVNRVMRLWHRLNAHA